jgi:protein ImuB
MFACLYLPPSARPEPRTAQGSEGSGLNAQERRRPGRDAGTESERRRGPASTGPASTGIVQLARDFSPRVEMHDDRTVTLDISGLGSLLGEARVIGEELRRTAADRALRVHVALASTATAAILLAQSRAGLVVIPPGGEAAALAPLPLSALEALIAMRKTAGSPPANKDDFDRGLHRWGLRTLGDLAAIGSADLSERLGQAGPLWQRWARGEDARPLVPAGVEEQFEESLDLEWPIDDLEPLSFVLARLCEPLCERLERRDRGAVALHVKLALVNKTVHERSLQLPAPMRDARVLRTLVLLDLESHPPPAAIDRVTIGVEVTEGRVLQFGLLARALPTERLTTLLARLGALMGSGRVGAPALVDSYRPGAFAMAKFEPSAETKGGSGPSGPLNNVIRRFRSPIPARVTLDRRRPVRVVTDRRGVSGGKVERCDGPWRSSGEWWAPYADCPAAAQGTHWWKPHAPWNCDEWDVMLSDGAWYRISRCIAERPGPPTQAPCAAAAHGTPTRQPRWGGSEPADEDRGQWFVDGMLD